MKKIFLILLLTATAFANIGTVMAVNGQAQVKRAKKMLYVKNGMTLLKGDEIITKTKTKVQVILNDDTAITIGPNSSFHFIDYMFDGSKKSKISMQATRGFFRSVTGKIGKIAPERFKVKTNLATIGIRGTDFSVQLEKNKASYLCNSGEIKVSFNNKVRNILAGDMLRLHLDGLTIKESPISNIHSGSTFQKRIPKQQLTDNLSDISEVKEDINDIQYDCQHDR